MTINDEIREFILGEPKPATCENCCYGKIFDSHPDRVVCRYSPQHQDRHLSDWCGQWADEWKDPRITEKQVHDLQAKIERIEQVPHNWTEKEKQMHALRAKIEQAEREKTEEDKKRIIQRIIEDLREPKS